MIKSGRLFTLFVLLMNILYSFADGSKDLYPSGTHGNRAYLNAIPYDYSPFANLGAHYVFAKLGETLAVASSAQNVGLGNMRITSPSGVIYSSLGSQLGKIEATASYTSREAELAGPGVGYLPYEIPVNEEGIWKVEFIPPVGENQIQNAANPPNERADGRWTQPNLGYVIAAWDISVRDMPSGSWISGRVYANVLNLYLTSSTLDQRDGAFYGVNYVLTEDGYIYKVNGNGSHGIQFSYFVNNTGFLDGNGASSYKSADAGYGAAIHNPNFADQTNAHVTHKMLYTVPDQSLPESSSGAVPGGTTWLLNAIEVAEITNITLVGSEGTLDHVNLKGSKIGFRTNYAGRYKITISSSDDQHPFPMREILVQADVGANQFFWDGKDGQGNLLPAGRQYPVDIRVGLVEGEIHFPYFDMEINPNGIRVDRINPDGSLNGAAILYWDDSAIAPGIPEEQSNPLINLEGISSYDNGHRWGSYQNHTVNNPNNVNNNYGAGSFGNNKGMDTWSYAVQIQEQQQKNITVEIADLEVVSVVANKTKIELGEPVTYTMVVKNNGPSDAIASSFSFDMPSGFTITAVSNHSVCGRANSVAYTESLLLSTLDLPNGCELTFVVTAVANIVPDDTYGFVDALAGIVRPRDYTDPDATSSNVDVLDPGSVWDECETDCNNMMLNKDVFLLEPYHERGQMELLKTVSHIDANQSGFHEVGEELEYTFRLRNIGSVEITNLHIVDSLLAPSILVPVKTSFLPNEEISVMARYKVTEDDVKNRIVVNTARVKGLNPRKFEVTDVSGSTYSNDESTKIDIDTKPILKLRKTVTNIGTGENNQFTIGDTISYHFTVKHTGYIPIVNLRLSDKMLFEGEMLLSPPELLEAEHGRKGQYLIKQTDIDQGVVENTATIYGEDKKYGHTLFDLSGLDFEDDIPTVTTLAKPSTAHNDTISFYQGNEGWITILQNDLVGSSSLTKDPITIIDLPKLGNVTLVNDKLRYIPKSNLNYGVDTLTYLLRDNSRLTSNIGQVEVNIKQTTPVAVDDNVFLGFNSKITIQPYINDYVVGSVIERESVRILSNPQNGQLHTIGNGEIVYVPNANYTGSDEFTYQIRDKNQNWSKPGIVVINIRGFRIPNTITPNGDGKNDLFVIIGSSQFDRVELEIIDRFGTPIFTSTNYINEWGGEGITDGTYYYIFKGFKSEEKTVVKKGFVLVSRDIRY